MFWHGDSDPLNVPQHDVAAGLPDRKEADLAQGLQDLPPGEAREPGGTSQLHGDLDEPGLLLLSLGADVF